MEHDIHRPALVEVDDLVHAVGELEAAILDMDGGAAERQIGAVDIGDFRHWRVIGRKR
jgi:hypothetical protein